MVERKDSAAVVLHSDRGVMVVKTDLASYRNVDFLYREVVLAFLKHAERGITGFCRMTVSYDSQSEGGPIVNFTLGPAIQVANDDGVVQPGFYLGLYTMLDNVKNKPSSSLGKVQALILRLYTTGEIQDFDPASNY